VFFGIQRGKTGYSPYATLILGSYGDIRKKAKDGSVINQRSSTKQILYSVSKLSKEQQQSYWRVRWIVYAFILLVYMAVSVLTVFKYLNPS
jgi:hypothetical protein